MRFVITGYPRSGHGWLANYLYKADSIVGHEGALSFLSGERTVRQAHVPYEKPYQLSTVARICNYVGEDFDLVRFALLRHTRVLQNTGMALESMEK